MTHRIVALDHVQLAMPPGREAEADADAFYRDLLGFEVLAKPDPLAGRGGRWYVVGDVQLHLGVEADFRPALKAHPALRVADLEALVTLLAAHGTPWRWDTDLPGVRRAYADDPFGNRIELIDASSPAHP